MNCSAGRSPRRRSHLAGFPAGLQGPHRTGEAASDLHSCADDQAPRRLLEQPGFLDDPSTVAPLLRAMQAEATVRVKPEALGVIGAVLIRQRWEDWYGIKANRFWYRKKAIGVDGIPVMIEVAVAQTEVPGDVSFGLNFAVPFRDPFGNILLQAGPIRTYGVRPFLQEAHVPLGGGGARGAMGLGADGDGGPCPSHLACAGLWFLSRGKAEMRPPRVVAAAVAAALWSACQELYKEGEAREKAAAQQAKRERKAREEAEKAATRAEHATRGSVKVPASPSWPSRSPMPAALLSYVFHAVRSSTPSAMPSTSGDIDAGPDLG